ncbi:TPA: hypothetical protein EYN98_15530 [Candidatus Poribacteria bacterium]|nr:hypothetical protein [Candidatus Poribacteria bacterium]HIB89903.1 hypothetical protein [Candidatus Poribacteria bacterium]HIB98617.1 hypothetical protein [Candidatus Poribacteria bacterium]HIO08267.1 hypothetical protein [Candidatus Poribacteria bacterium]HIO81908.1 hypothetical protein [Candidatus Poribacteria bacterium]
MKFGAFTKKYQDTDTDPQGGGPMQEGTKPWDKSKKPASYSYAMVGLVSAILILGVTFLILGIFDPGEDIKDFIARWEQAVESKQPEKYQKLWDKGALKRNRVQYERAENLVKRQGKVDADVRLVSPRRDFRHSDRRRIDQIPVKLYKNDELTMTIYRDLVIQKKGLRKQWQLIVDRVNGDIEHHEAAQNPPEEEIQEVLTAGSLGVATTLGSPKEATVNSQLTSSSATMSGSAPLDTKLKLSQVLGDWQQAWQTKDLKQYMDKYAEEAAITRVSVRNGKEYPKILTKAQLRESMKRVNKTYSKIEVYISNLQINGDHAVADVGFLQEFKGTSASGSRPAYQDFGTKTLIFMVDPSDGLWKIYSESWKLYKEVPNYPKS